MLGTAATLPGSFLLSPKHMIFIPCFAALLQSKVKMKHLAVGPKSFQRAVNLIGKSTKENKKISSKFLKHKDEESSLALLGVCLPSAF